MRFPVKTNMTQRDAVEVAAFLRQLAAVVERRCPDQSSVEADTLSDGTIQFVSVAVRW